MFYKENTNSLINNLREMFYKITIKNDVDSNLDLRMRKLVTTYNNRKCHGFQPFVISLKCKSLMKYINDLKTFEKKTKQLNERCTLSQSGLSRQPLPERCKKIFG